MKNRIMHRRSQYPSGCHDAIMHKDIAHLTDIGVLKKAYNSEWAVPTLRIKPLRNKQELRQSLGMVNIFFHMWRCRSHLLRPFTELVSKDSKFQWTSEHQKAFENVKQSSAKKPFWRIRTLAKTSTSIQMPVISN